MRVLILPHVYACIFAQPYSTHTLTSNMPFKSTQPDISRKLFSSRLSNQRLIYSIERSADRCHNLGLAIRLPFLFAQKEFVLRIAWLQQCHHRRADQLRSGSRSDDLSIDSSGSKIWIEKWRSSGIIQP